MNLCFLYGPASSDKFHLVYVAGLSQHHDASTTMYNCRSKSIVIITLDMTWHAFFITLMDLGIKPVSSELTENTSEDRHLVFRHFLFHSTSNLLFSSFFLEWAEQCCLCRFFLWFQISSNQFSNYRGHRGPGNALVFRNRSIPFPTVQLFLSGLTLQVVD